MISNPTVEDVAEELESKITGWARELDEVKQQRWIKDESTEERLAIVGGGY